MRLLPLFLLLACSGGSGSDTGSEESCESNTETSLEIGSGASSYEPLDSGAAIMLVHGAQGGYHIEIGLRATGIDASDLIAADFTGEIGGVQLAQSKPWLQFRCNPATSTWDAWGTTLIYDSTPEELNGQSTDVHVTLTDVSGVDLSADLTLTIEDPLVQ